MPNNHTFNDIENLYKKCEITKRALALTLLSKLDCNLPFFNHMNVKSKNQPNNLLDITLMLDKKYKVLITLKENNGNVDISISQHPSQQNDITCNKNSLSLKIDELYNAVIEKAKEELREASHHLAYEFAMLAYSYQLFNYLSGIAVKNNANTSSVSQIINNMRVEALRMHIRVLLEFFEQRGNNKKRFDDIVYEDFFCDMITNNSKSFTQRFSNNIEDIKNKIHLTTAHLSYIRVDQPKYDREPNLNEINQVIKEICDNMENFYNNVDKNLLEEAADRDIDNILKNFCKTLIQNQSNPTATSSSSNMLNTTYTGFSYFTLVFF